MKKKSQERKISLRENFFLGAGTRNQVWTSDLKSFVQFPDREKKFFSVRKFQKFSCQISFFKRTFRLQLGYSKFSISAFQALN